MGKTRTRNTATAKKPLDFWARMKDISRFFQGRDEVHKSLRRLVKRLERAGIAYAVVGAMAVNAHKHKRTTSDVDVLVTAEGLEEFRKRFVKKNYLQKEGRPRRFVDRLNEVEVDFLVTGLFPGRGGPGPISFPDPTRVSEEINRMQVINLVTLIELKLAARRYYDFGDVVGLIAVHDLDESFAERLHPSVRRDYIEC